jgi:AraC-like DNA-binding protein
MPVDIVELSTNDPEVAHATLGDLYPGDQPVRLSGDSSDFTCSLRLSTAGSVGADQVRHTMMIDVSMAPAESFAAICVAGGLFDDFTFGDEQLRLGRGDVVCYGRGTQITGVCDGLHVAALRIPFSAVDRVAAEHADASEPVRFAGVRPVSDGAAARWRRLQGFVLREIGAPDSMLDSTLVQAQVTDMIAAAAITTFPNSAMAASEVRARGTVAPSSIRRAAAFIDTNAHEPLTITQIAERAGVTPRALQYGFTRHLDTTPMAYARRVRLDRAHDELRSTDPTGPTTVGEIARRWGFANTGRFASAYRGAYGVSPSQTLHDAS